MKLELLHTEEMSAVTESSGRLATPRVRSITFPQRKKKRTYKKLFLNIAPPSINDWEFNVFSMDKSTNGRSLFHVGLRILQEHGLVETFHLDIVKLMRCLSLIEDGYVSSNEYHNAMHAADVTQAMHCYLNEPKIAEHVTPLEKLAAILSALAHDVAHPGVNNAFLITTGSHLATLYNNDSVLENHHWRTAVSIYHQTGLFEHLDKETVVAIETQSKSLILATDMAKQRAQLDVFTECLNSDSLCMKNEESRHIVMKMAIKCADLSNTTRPWDISSNWSKLICQEFFRQGDLERKLGLPVASLNDRHSTTVPQIQTGFMQFVVQPLLSLWQRFNPSQLTDKMIANLQSNKAEWDALIQRAKTEPSSDATSSDTSASAGNSSNKENEAHQEGSTLDTDNNITTKRPAAKKRSHSIPFGKNFEQTSDHMAILKHLQQQHSNSKVISTNNNNVVRMMTSQFAGAGRRSSLPIGLLSADDTSALSRHVIKQLSNHVNTIQTIAAARFNR